MNAGHVGTCTRRPRETTHTQSMQVHISPTSPRIGGVPHVVQPRAISKARVWKWLGLPRTNNSGWVGTRWRQGKRVSSSMVPSCFSLPSSFLVTSCNSPTTQFRNISFLSIRECVIFSLNLVFVQASDWGSRSWLVTFTRLFFWSPME